MRGAVGIILIVKIAIIMRTIKIMIIIIITIIITVRIMRMMMSKSLVTILTVERLQMSELVDWPCARSRASLAEHGSAIGQAPKRVLDPGSTPNALTESLGKGTHGPETN